MNLLQIIENMSRLYGFSKFITQTIKRNYCKVLISDQICKFASVKMQQNHKYLNVKRFEKY